MCVCVHIKIQKSNCLKATPSPHLVVSRRPVIDWNNVDHVLCCHMKAYGLREIILKAGNQSMLSYTITMTNPRWGNLYWDLRRHRIYQGFHLLALHYYLTSFWCGIRTAMSASLRLIHCTFLPDIKKNKNTQNIKKYIIQIITMRLG